MKRVVITGLGIISSIGNNKEEVLASLKEGKSGIEFVPEFAEVGMRSQVAGTIKLNPAELIDSKQMEKFIATVKAKYDYVIIDSAPVYNLADSLIISKKADRTMIVCRVNKTNIDHVKDGLKSLQAIDANIAGVILNQIPLEKRTGYYNQYYL